jgi:uncharacterized membrane protein (TIGR02234 family)
VTSRRELLLAVLLCLAGAALVLLATSRPWLTLRVPAAAPLPTRTLTRNGSAIAGGARALGLVGLAGVAALPATRRIGRVVVGGLLALSGTGIVTVLVRVLAHPVAAVARSGPFPDAHVAGPVDLGGWPYLALIGGGLLAAAGLLVVVRGRRWEVLSERYEPPAAQGPPGEASFWEALDRGEDPTGSPSSPQ